MNYTSKPVLLSSRETYEIYEKRSTSPMRPVGVGGYTYSPAPTHPAAHVTPAPLVPARNASRDPRAGSTFCGGPYGAPPKSHSPSVHFDDSITMEPQRYSQQPQQQSFVESGQGQNGNSFAEKISTMFPSLQQKRNLPIGWIICVAVSVPIFVMITLFLAVWLQELGFL